MRDKLKDKNYFESLINSRYKSMDKSLNMLNDGLIKDDRILSVKKMMTYDCLQIIGAKYSIGAASSQELKNDISNGIQLLNEAIVDNKGKIDAGNKIFLDQYYVHIHQEILQYLSLAYLLDIPETDFNVLVNIIDRDNISDDLYEFIIKARFPDRKQKRAEEYDTDKSVILKVYDKLRKATKQSDKNEAAKLVKFFLEKSFYHKDMNSYNSHKSKANIYSGYWSFEAAAVVKILSLDDSSFANNQYYPKDLVHFNN
ncbi:PoNe immunity protein domain-containing protein [Flavobacterium sp. LM4]|uniref:PoNe immunity protein domain-containing protein n=1 Tax=Flavobacterium sp. LM4 TaxID=1938609 RepID=UPI0016703365|nr:PoNe immunity protein domain-containing protein [Flavobacterium sp. LM4]